MGVKARELQDAWFRRALDSAGIERASWHPGRGVEENRRTVEAVYGYYGRLFIEHPYLQWAGLAGMIGPAFYAGFRDLGVLPDPVRGAVIAVLGRASRPLAGLAAGDLGFYEATFLAMQKKIFEDQAAMHEAYLSGGVAQIEEFYREGIIDAATLQTSIGFWVVTDWNVVLPAIRRLESAWGLTPYPNFRWLAESSGALRDQPTRSASTVGA